MLRWFKWLGLGLVIGGLVLAASVKTYIASLNRQEVMIAIVGSTTTVTFPEAGEVRVYYFGLDVTSGMSMELSYNNQTKEIAKISNGKYIDTGVTVAAGGAVQEKVYDSPNFQYPAYGWIPGDDGLCMNDDISAYINTAEAYGKTLVSIQCWANFDSASEGEDYDDYVVILSYVPAQGDAACKVQGYKVEAPDNIRSGPFADQAVRIAGKAEDKNNPYYLQGLNLGQTYTVSVEPESGYRSGYSVCYNQIGCHDNVNVRWDKISDSFTCPTASASGQTYGYVDLWWHFQPRAGSPSPSPSASPGINQAGFVIHKFLDVNKNGVRETGESATNRTWEFEYRIDGGEKQSYMIEPGEEEGEKIIVNKGAKVKVAELGQEGWLNTTGAELTKTLADPKLYTFYFGNWPVGGAPPAGGFPPTQPDTGTPTWITLSLALSITVITIIKVILKV